MHYTLVGIHLFGAAVWLGGTVALVFVAVPAIRTLEGEPRARALRTIGQRWRPIGWGALTVLVGSGIWLADDEGAFDSDVLFGSTYGAVLLTKIVLVGALIGAAALHDFVLGPRLARQIRERQPPSARPALVSVGWTSFSLSVIVPALGVVLAEVPLR